MGLADIRATRELAIEEPFGDAALAVLATVGRRLGADAKAEVVGQGVPQDAVSVHVRAHIRYAGTDTALVVAAGSPDAVASLGRMKSAFEAAHKSRFGFIDETKQLVIEAVSVEAVGGGAKFSEPTHQATGASPPAPARQTRFYSGSHWHQARAFTREQLSPGHKIPGPAIV